MEINNDIYTPYILLHTLNTFIFLSSSLFSYHIINLWHLSYYSILSLWLWRYIHSMG